LRVLGADHPDLVESHMHLARCATVDERFDDAGVHNLRALELARRTLGPVHFTFADVLEYAAFTEARAGRLDAAARYYTEARTVNAHNGRPERVALTTHSLGIVLYRSHRLRDALAELAEAERQLEALASQHESRSTLRISRGDVHRALGQLDTALALYREALAGFAAVGTASYQSYRALAHLEIALVHLERGRAAAARDELEVAYTTNDHTNDWGKLLPPIRFHLARALVAAGGDRERAFTLAREARDSYAARPHGAPMVTDIDAWLADPTLTARASARGHADGLSVWGPLW
jgi:tetratricopeptide (TPR) repeat protein